MLLRPTFAKTMGSTPGSACLYDQHQDHNASVVSTHKLLRAAEVVFDISGVKLLCRQFSEPNLSHTCIEPEPVLN